MNISREKAIRLSQYFLAYMMDYQGLKAAILYTSAYRPHCRISRPHFYPVGIRASGSTQSIWP